MDYNETVTYLFNSTPVFEKIGAGAYKEGLSNTLALDNHLSHPHHSFTTIHVAGTNGKGSVSHTLAAILQTAGYHTGLFTSPHLVDFRERIRVDGLCVSEAFVIDFVEKHRHFFEPLRPSFFELTTAMAFDYFRQQHVDIAVIEVGLGGRLDCTNIISPILSVITNISFDHTQFLGDTLPRIAAEKAGIIKPGIPVVIGEALPETRPVFINKAQAEGAPLIFAEDCSYISQAIPTEDGGIDYDTAGMGILHGELGGTYQVKNANTILAAVEQLRRAGLSISQDDIKKGFAEVCHLTGLMGRWQRIQENPLVICDTGHNVGGWQYLARQIKSQACDKCRIVFGMVDDKDIDTVLSLLPANATFYFTKASSKRAIDERTVQQKAKNKGLNGQAFPSVAAAYRTALSEASPHDFIFVGGSSYVVADLLESLSREKRQALNSLAI